MTLYPRISFRIKILLLRRRASVNGEGTARRDGSVEGATGNGDANRPGQALFDEKQEEQYSRITRAGAVGRVAADDIAVGAISKRSRESRRPLRVRIVDGNEASRACTHPSVLAPLRHPSLPLTASERDLRALRADPVGKLRVADLVAEGDHVADRGPAVLADPAARAAVVGTRAGVAVGRAVVRVGELEGGEDGRGAVGVREREDHRGGVDVVGGVVVEGVAALGGLWVSARYMR